MNLAIWQSASAAAAGVGLAGTSAYFSPLIWRQHRIGMVRKRLAERRTIVLTYDDGPSRTMTPQILDLLRRHNARASFFMLGRQTRLYPKTADRVIREGHDAGCHSYDHLNAWKAAPWRTLSDIRAGYEQLSPWVPQNGMFRPPHGKMTLATYWALRRRRAPVWWWTVDSGDTHDRMPDPGEVVDIVRRDGGGIVLMHDLDREKERNDYVLEATDALLDLAKRESFKIVTLKELCK